MATEKQKEKLVWELRQKFFERSGEELVWQDIASEMQDNEKFKDLNAKEAEEVFFNAVGMTDGDGTVEYIKENHNIEQILSSWYGLIDAIETVFSAIAKIEQEKAVSNTDKEEENFFINSSLFHANEEHLLKVIHFVITHKQCPKVIECVEFIKKLGLKEKHNILFLLSGIFIFCGKRGEEIFLEALGKPEPKETSLLLAYELIFRHYLETQGLFDN